MVVEVWGCVGGGEWWRRCGGAWVAANGGGGVRSVWVAVNGGGGLGGAWVATQPASPSAEMRRRPALSLRAIRTLPRPIHWVRLTDWSSHASSRGGGRDR